MSPVELKDFLHFELARCGLEEEDAPARRIAGRNEIISNE